MKKTLIGLYFCAFVVSCGTGARAGELFPLAKVSDSYDLPLRISIEPDPSPLTTEMVIEINPGMVNPHRKRWALFRYAELIGLRSIELKNGRFGVKVDGLKVNLRTYLRADGPWFRKMEEFPCGTRYREEFATKEGSVFVTEEASRRFESLVGRKKGRLAVSLAKVSASTPEIGLLMAKDLFEQWQRELQNLWNTELRKEIEKSEWNYYQKRAADLGLCKRAGGKEKPVSWTWTEMMEEAGPNLPPPRLVGRAPARRWNGMFSIRATLHTGNRILNGQFLLDSGAPISLVSPAWLASQGVVAATVEVPFAPPEKVNWLGNSDSGLARRAQFDSTEIGGTPLPLKEFLIFETDFFGIPENLASCCDGVLGSDFLSQVVTEWVPGSKGALSEVKIWDTRLFRPEKPSQYFWVEAGVGSGGMLGSSACEAKIGKNVYSPLHWDTGNDDAILFYGKESSHGGASVSCRGNKLNRSESPVSYDSGSADAGSTELVAGMGFLGRGRFILDLPHGRIWFSKDTEAVPFYENRSGLELQYVLIRGDRVLRVKKIDPRKSLESLRKHGLKVGMEIQELDSIPAVDMDDWEVERRLSGFYSDTVILKWETGDEITVSPLRVR